MKFRAFLAVLLCLLLPAIVSASHPPQEFNVPILLYHRFGPTVADSMTIKTPVFEEQLRYLRDNGYRVIPLRQVVDFYLKKGPVPPPKSVVIVEDDAHKSVYTDMLPGQKVQCASDGLHLPVCHIQCEIRHDLGPAPGAEEYRALRFSVPYILASQLQEGSEEAAAGGVRQTGGVSTAEITGKDREGAGGDGGHACLALRHL